LVKNIFKPIVQYFKKSDGDNNEIRMGKSNLLIKFALFFVSQFFVLPGILQAQLCHGNPGNPIINITFGTGGSKLPAAVTSFEYAGGCPAKGKYTVSKCAGYTKLFYY
jgi:hypothetical protein